MRQLLSSLLIALFSSTLAQATREVPEIRVAIGRSESPVTVHSESLNLTKADGSLLYMGDSAEIVPTQHGFRINQQDFKTEEISIHSSSPLKINGKSYLSQVIFRRIQESKKPMLLMIHPVALETYVESVVSHEMPGSWPIEALKAQAIAVRTYALNQKERRINNSYHVESSTLDQVYGGNNASNKAASTATKATCGVVMTYKDKPAQAFFHSTCGGKTESALDGFGTKLEYLPGSKCGFCKAATYSKWNATFTKSEVDNALSGILGEPPNKIDLLKRSKTGRILRAKLSGKSRTTTIKGTDLRRALGYIKFRSTLITKLSFANSLLNVEGEGYGHGVGMCQWGARGMALAGKSAEQILKNYYLKLRIHPIAKCIER